MPYTRLLRQVLTSQACHWLLFNTITCLILPTDYTPRRTYLSPPPRRTGKMPHDTTNLQALVQQYHQSDDEGREQLFRDLYTSHYNGPRTVPGDLADLLKTLLLSLDLLPTTAGAETMETVVIDEICFGMQRFCLSRPPGIDYAWDATTRFVSLVGPHASRAGANLIHTLSSWLTSSTVSPSLLRTIIVIRIMSPVVPCEATTLLLYPYLRINGTAIVASNSQILLAIAKHGGDASSTKSSLHEL